MKKIFASLILLAIFGGVGYYQYDKYKHPEKYTENTTVTTSEKKETPSTSLSITPSAATSAASAFMQKDTPEMKMFKESMRQTEKAIFDYTSNVESFQREVAPSLALSTGKSQLLESDGLALIEQYKQKRLNKS